MMIRSALSTTYWLVAPRWMIPLAAGAASSNVWTWAITSWRSRFSQSAAAVEVDVVELRLHLPQRFVA